MGYLYTSRRPSTNQGGTLPQSWSSNTDLNQNLGPEFQPTAQSAGGIDVIREFPWTLTPTTSKARQTAPYIRLTEYYQLDTQLNQMFKPYDRQGIASLLTALQSPVQSLATAAGNVTSFTDAIAGFGSAITSAINLLTIDANIETVYQGLFDHLNPTGFSYILPYFNTEYFRFNNRWEGVDILDKVIDLQVQSGSFLLKGLGGAINAVRTFSSGSTIDFGPLQTLANLPRVLKDIEIFNLQTANPAVGLMDPPKVWKGADPRTYTFQFALYNIDMTNSKDSAELIAKNWEFCYLLTYQNLMNKRNFYTAIPPVFYEVEIPGVHYCKASYMSNLKIENIGNIRKLKLAINGTNNIDVNVPDAYLVSVTMTDLLTPSKNLLAATVSSSARAAVKTR